MIPRSRSGSFGVVSALAMTLSSYPKNEITMSYLPVNTSPNLNSPFSSLITPFKTTLDPALFIAIEANGTASPEMESLTIPVIFPLIFGPRLLPPKENWASETTIEISNKKIVKVCFMIFV